MECSTKFIEVVVLIPIILIAVVMIIKIIIHDQFGMNGKAVVKYSAPINPSLLQLILLVLILQLQ